MSVLPLVSTLLAHLLPDNMTFEINYSVNNIKNLEEDFAILKDIEHDEQPTRDESTLTMVCVQKKRIPVMN